MIEVHPLQYWLFKSEPDVFGIDHLSSRPHQTEHWDGVRNYQVRNMLRDQIQPGDLGFFYHSNAKPPGIVGVIEVVTSGYPDHTAWDSASKYFDADSTPQNPRWYMVDVRFVRKFDHIITLEMLRNEPALDGMLVTRKGCRLSITPVTSHEWETIMAMPMAK